MNLIDKLKKREKEILENWVAYSMDSYPEQTAGFLKKQKNRFANPVGFTLESSLQGLFRALTSELTADSLFPYLDDLIKIRSVQDFSPAEAVSFIFPLKKILRELLIDEIKAEGLFEELLAFESKIDKLSLYAFDNYMKYREKVFEIKSSEKIRSIQKIIDRTNKLSAEQENKVKDK